MITRSSPFDRFTRVLFSGVAAVYALLLLGIAHLSLQFSGDADLPSRTDTDAWDFLLAAALVAVCLVFCLGAVAAWAPPLPLRRWLVHATIAGIVAFNTIWVLNALGVTELYI